MNEEESNNDTVLTHANFQRAFWALAALANVAAYSTGHNLAVFSFFGVLTAVCICVKYLLEVEDTNEDDV